MSSVVAALRRTVSQAPRLSRSLQTGKAARSGGGHDAHHGDDYVHREHMYEAWNIKHRKLKWGVATTLFVCGGFGLPVAAITYSQSKMAG